MRLEESPSEIFLAEKVYSKYVYITKVEEKDEILHMVFLIFLFQFIVNGVFFLRLGLVQHQWNTCTFE